MSWRHRIAVVVLIVLAGLPVGGAICAFACEEESAAVAAHHGTEQDCADVSGPPLGPVVHGASPEDCNAHERALRSVPTTAAERADLAATSAPSAVNSPVDNALTRPHGLVRAESISPPISDPPSLSRIVLRV